MNPNNMPGSGRFVQTRVATPTATFDQAAATWRGSSMLHSRVFPILGNATYSAKGRGLFNLTETVPPKDARFPRGPRVGQHAGTIDAWLTAGSAGGDFILFQSGPDLTTPYHTVYLDNTGKLGAYIQDELGNVVVSFLSASIATAVNTRLCHVRIAWDSRAAISGTATVVASLNGNVVPSADYSAGPAVTWTGFYPTHMAVGDFADPTLDATVELVQLSAAPVLT